MKGNKLLFAQHPPRYATKIRSRALGLRNFVNAAYKEDGGESEEDKPEALLLAKIKETITTEITTRGYADGPTITSLLTEQLKDLPLEKLRVYEADKTKLDVTILKISGELEKLRSSNITRGEAVNHLRETLQLKMKDIEGLFARRGQGAAAEISFNIRAAAVMTTANTIDETDVPDDLIESFSMAAFVPKRYGYQFIGDIADITTVSEIAARKTWLEEGDEQGAFAIVAEGGLKPLVSYDLVRNIATYRKIAGKYVITEEFAKFRKEAYTIIRRLIQDKMYRDYDAILTTDLNASAVGYTGTILDGTIIAPNDYDAIGAVASQIESLNFTPDVLIINPQDKWRIRLTKDNEGRYLFPVVTQDGMTIMMGLRLITSTYQTVGSFTIGESGLFKIEQETLTVRVGYGVTVTGSNPVTSVVSDFDNNQMRIIVENYFNNWLATNHIGSYVKTTFATVKTALMAP